MNLPKVAIVGASHWHVPLYIEEIKNMDCMVCGVQDQTPEVANELAVFFNSVSYTDIDKLLKEAKPDFVFAFAKHSDMASLAKKLIDMNIAFAMEKPVGLNFEQVKTIEKHASDNGVFCSIPFVWRFSEAVTKLREKFNPEEYNHLSFQFIAGPPDRYIENGTPWMLDSDIAGGGCMTNLGVHFLDLALFLTNSNSLRVLSSNFHYNFNYSVEDYAVTHLETDSGATISIEAGYAFPMSESKKRENSWKLVTRNGYHTLSENCLELRVFNENVEKIPVVTDSDDLYPIFVRETLKDWMAGRSPSINLSHMSSVRKVLDDINKIASK
ncbi:Gfo/Idh/MocA family protein [Oceanobacillus sp. CFH 90083]|uniref:Gfo/Idh/MocA family protein n=1 Tax=Oceanobacillus sp. CFH 90083 TaxID=2592336 RepID=UPI00128C2FF2|nr:Gfo/Idh/MocA family oxidoreductase [Oceanobacillus sp. CFH 90083]